MYSSRKNSREALQRTQERRQREDESSRLESDVPGLSSLRIDVVENAGGTTVKYAKVIVVARAPALFVFNCGDPRCVGGGHDVTSTIMRALRSRITSFEGESSCEGMTGSAQCGRSIRYSYQATFRA